MLASIKWLKDYVDIDVTAEELAERLTRVGLEVEQILHLDKGISGVVTGKVCAIERHPNSDHLWTCQIDYGSGELVQILTGAQNVRLGDMVPVATVGATLPSGMKLKKAKMRGLDSFGMLCSAEELGIDSKLLLPEQRNGIFILPVDTPIGQDIREVLGLDDVVLDIDLTSNRADCFSIYGLAREAAAVLGKELKPVDYTVQEAAGGNATELATIKVMAPELCTRFGTRVLKNVRTVPSPLWMCNRLRACGVRPISNVVDVTNYVMLELGQPMHAYDYDKVGEHTLIVRRGGVGEKLTTLDGKERILDASMITIADPTHAVGLGGVMGGLETEVTAATVNVMLEAATFNGPSIRRTSKALGLRSEASGRFERGVDTGNNHGALNRAAHLLEQMGACDTVAGITESYPVPEEPIVIKVTVPELCGLIGTQISKEEICTILRSLQFGVVENDAFIEVTVPSWRKDCAVAADISEEIARIHGYDNIQSHVPRLDVVQGRQAALEDVKDAVEDYLAAAGLAEIMTYSFISASYLDKLGLASDDKRRQVIRLMNPISDEFSVMRTTMVPSILNTVTYNLARQHSSVAVFEVGKVFLPTKLPLTEYPTERRVLAVALAGLRRELSWTQPKESFDFFDMKGLVEGLFEHLGITGASYESVSEPYLHAGKSCAIKVGEEVIGYFGAVHPKVQDSFGLAAETYVLEMNIEPLVKYALTVPQYQSLPKFPSSARDIAVVVPKEVSRLDLENVIRASGGELLKDIRVFDIYEGAQVGKGRKSVAFNLTFQAKERTLVDSEVDEIIKRIVDNVGTTYAAKLRD